jgi:hypothetical protein
MAICVYLRLPRVYDRDPDGDKSIKFEYSFCDKNIRTCAPVNDIILDLYTKGVSFPSINSIIPSIFNENVRGFSTSNLSLIKESFSSIHEQFITADLSAYNNHAIAMDAVYVSVKNREKKMCILSVVSISNDAYKVIGWHLAEDESEEEWTKLFSHLKEAQGMGLPRVVVTDGGKGGLAAIASQFKGALIQRCWVHKIRNICDDLQYHERAEAANLLSKIHQSESYDIAIENFNYFINRFSHNKKVVKSLTTDIEQLLTFFKINDIDKSRIYTTNCVESLFSVVQIRLDKVRGNYSVLTIEFTTFSFIMHLYLAGGYGIKLRNKELLPYALRPPQKDGPEAEPEPEAERDDGGPGSPTYEMPAELEPAHGDVLASRIDTRSLPKRVPPGDGEGLDADVCPVYTPGRLDIAIGFDSPPTVSMSNLIELVSIQPVLLYRYNF